MNNKKNIENNNSLAFVLISFFIAMLLFSFAAVPLYSLFCKATGFGGTTQIMQDDDFHHIKKGSKKIRVYFDANLDSNLPWKFKPLQRYIDIISGEVNLIFYEVENLSNDDIMGTAIYNVTPDKTGKYFVKVHCFCFEEQIISAKSKMIMPVAFYIDADIDDDASLKDNHEITLSYSFFRGSL